MNLHTGGWFILVDYFQSATTFWVNLHQDGHFSEEILEILYDYREGNRTYTSIVREFSYINYRTFRNRASFDGSLRRLLNEFQNSPQATQRTRRIVQRIRQPIVVEEREEITERDEREANIERVLNIMRQTYRPFSLQRNVPFVGSYFIPTREQDRDNLTGFLIDWNTQNLNWIQIQNDLPSFVRESDINSRNLMVNALNRFNAYSTPLEGKWFYKLKVQIQINGTIQDDNEYVYGSSLRVHIDFLRNQYQMIFNRERNDWFSGRQWFQNTPNENEIDPNVQLNATHYEDLYRMLNLPTETDMLIRVLSIEYISLIIYTRVD